MKEFQSPVSGFSVATYNVHQWIGTDGRHDSERVVRVIRELEADIIGLQEVTFPKETNVQVNAAYLSSATNMEVILGPTVTRSDDHFGNVLLTCHRVREVRRINLSVDSREPRGALDVDLDVHGAHVRVVVTHLGLRPYERRHQIRNLLDSVCFERTDLCIMMGDFNLWTPISLALKRLKGRFGRVPAHRTYPSRFPLLPLDRIWVNPRDALKSVFAHRTRDARKASDHLPIKALIGQEARNQPVNNLGSLNVA